jgi:hypothetical protein
MPGGESGATLEHFAAAFQFGPVGFVLPKREPSGGWLCPAKTKAGPHLALFCQNGLGRELALFCQNENRSPFGFVLPNGFFNL